METSHRERVAAMLSDASREHRTLLERLPAEIAASLPVDAQGLTHAIDHLATVAGLSPSERRAMLAPHAGNPAVLHARVFGAASPLAPATVIGAFVDGARVRAEALASLADTVGGEPLGTEIRALLVEYPPPGDAGAEAVSQLRATYAAQERAALTIAAALDADAAD